MTGVVVARGRAGEKRGPIHVHFWPDGTVRGECDANPEFWLKTYVPRNIGNLEARGDGAFKGKPMTGVVVKYSSDGYARADAHNCPEFWLEFKVPRAFRVKGLKYDDDEQDVQVRD